jgi:hypothetical protein
MRLVAGGYFASIPRGFPPTSDTVIRKCSYRCRLDRVDTTVIYCTGVP